VAAGALVLSGVYYGVKCVVNIIREAFTTTVETSGKGKDMAQVADGLNKDLKAHNIKRDKKEEANLQNTINEIINDTEHTYKISTKIEREDGTYIHTEDEKGNLNEINAKFQQEFNHKEEIINFVKSIRNVLLTVPYFLKLFFRKNFLFFYKSSANIHNKLYMLTPCKHIFHYDCLKKWIDDNVLTPKCPNCNYNLINNLLQMSKINVDKKNKEPISNNENIRAISILQNSHIRENENNEQINNEANSRDNLNINNHNNG